MGSFLRGPIHVELSPFAAHVRTARLIAVAAAREWGVPVERLDEVRMAVGEACTRAVNAHGAQGIEESVVVECGVDGLPAMFSVVVRDVAKTPSGDPVSDSWIGPEEFADTLANNAAAVELAVAGHFAADMHVTALEGGGTQVRMRWAII